MMNNKVNLFDIENENAVLGAALIDPNFVMPEVTMILNEDDFYASRSKIIYKALVNLYLNKIGIDTVTCSNYLKENDLLSLAGGSVFLAQLSNNIPTTANVQYYAQIVKEKSNLRKLKNYLHVAIENINNGIEDKEIINDLEKKMIDLTENNSQKVINLKEGTLDFLNELQERMKNREKSLGLLSGYSSIDSLVHGFKKGDLIIIAARPSVGKSALAINISLNVIKKQKKNVLFFSLEMSNPQNIMRIWSSETGIESQKLQDAFLNANDFQKLSAKISENNEVMNYLRMCDVSGMSYLDIRNHAYKTKIKYGLDLIIVDYLQLISIPFGKKEENRQNTVSEISRNLKIIAKDLNVPLIALSQLSREVEKGGREPRLSDLRESGSLEQDADVVAFLHRPDNENNPNEIEFILSKSRNGAIGKRSLYFHGNKLRFDDLAKI